MKKLIFLSMFIIFISCSTVFALGTKTSVQKISENSIKITVASKDKIKLTGYTISKGSNIIVYFINDSIGTNEDAISVDIRTVVRPYRVILENAEKPFEVPFVDIKNSQLRDYIRHLYDAGYINGYEEDNTFRPDNNITRAEFITMISRMLNLEHVKVADLNFADLEIEHWAYDDVTKVVENGIIEGYDENGSKLLKLDQNVTIAEVCKIVDEAFKIKNKSSANYDVRFVNHWAKANIQSLVNENIISSVDNFYEKGELDRPAKRREVAMFLSRTVGR